MEQLLATIGHGIRMAREIRGLSQETLAARAGINNSFLSQVERGRKAPSLKTIHAIARELDVPVSQLFADEDATTSAVVEREVADILDAAPTDRKKALVDLLRVGLDLTGR